MSDLHKTREYERHQFAPRQDGFARAADAMKDELLARIAALEATIERLKCCGNCGRHVRGLRSCIEGSDLWTEGDNRICHFTPSRWAERSEQ